MKQNMSIMFISAIASVMVVGAFATGGFSNSPLMIATADNTAKESPMGMYGHLELVARDTDGNIIKYIQSDNTIVNIGENCVGELLFDVASDDPTHACSGTGITAGNHGSSTNGFTFIAVGDGSGGTDNSVETNTALTGENSTGTMARQEDTSVVFTDSTGTSSSATVVVDATFTSVGGTSTVDESGVFDASTSGNMLARHGFADISLGAGDSLDVTWTFTIGS